MIQHATLYRFSKMIQTPANQLDHVLVSKMIGANKDLLEVYKAMKRDQLIREHAKAAGISLTDVLSLIDSQKQP